MRDIIVGTISDRRDALVLDDAQRRRSGSKWRTITQQPPTMTIMVDERRRRRVIERAHDEVALVAAQRKARHEVEHRLDAHAA